MAIVEAGNFRLTVGDSMYPIPADSRVDKTLWLTTNNVVVGAPLQHFRVVVTDVGGKVLTDKVFQVGLAAVGIHVPKGGNLVTILADASGPNDLRTAFWLE